jgi:hypothetical protein
LYNSEVCNHCFNRLPERCRLLPGLSRTTAVVASIAISLALVSCNRVALDERFHNPTLANWTVIDDPDTVEGPSNWVVEKDGWLHQRSNIWGKRGDFLDRWYGTLIVAGDVSWEDYTLSVRVRPGDNDGFGIVFRFIDPEHFYRLLFLEGDMNGGPLARLDKRSGSDYTQLWSSNRGYKEGKEATIAIDLQGSRIKAMFDGATLFEVSDSSYGRGKIGLFCFAQSDQAFDEVRVILR